MAKKFYDVEPHAPGKKKADSPNVQNIALGTPTPKMVPHAPGAIHSFGHSAIGGSHGYGHAPALRVGHLRLSGSAGAHQLGKK